MPPTYKGIINNLNMLNVLMLGKIVYIFYIKKTKLIDLGAIKEKKTHFAT